MPCFMEVNKVSNELVDTKHGKKLIKINLYNELYLKT